MIAAIEAASTRAYAAAMRSIVLRLLALVAVLLLPLGMTAAPAHATPHDTTSMPMQHCPEQGSKHRSNGAFAECTMACSSALPAADRLQEQPIPYGAQFIATAAIHVLHGLHPHPATPPPKLS